MDKSILVKILGFPATLIHGDTLVLDRWFWLKKHLPQTANGETLIDIGCGSGSFTLGAARLGYKTLGLSWDERNQKIARERTLMCNVPLASFEVLDVRQLDTQKHLIEQFDVAICFENIEHIINDRKLFKDITACLKPGGRLLLTTPNYHYRPLSSEDNGPFLNIEDGGHVRRGYTKAMLIELCEDSGLMFESESFCSGFLSQKITSLYRALSKIHPLLAWAIILPLRILPPIFDRAITKLIDYPYYCICIEAYKPKYIDKQKLAVGSDLVLSQNGNAL